MTPKIVRSEEEIDDVLEQVAVNIEDGSAFPGLSYEEGIQEFWRWLTDESASNPLE